MQDSISYSRKTATKKGDKEMLQKNRVLIKIGELLLEQGMLTLEEKKAYDQIAQE